MKRLIFVSLIILLANNVFADEKKPSILGKAFDKIAEPLNMIFTPYHRLDPIVVTPSRYEEPSLDVGKNITIIDEKMIRDSHAQYVPELLRSVAGVFVRDYVGNGKTAHVDIRGFGESALSNVLVLVDGRRTNQIDISGTDWIQIDVDNIKRIEILRGPQTVLYGDNASGGVVNIITKNGAGKRPEMGFAYQTGSYRYHGYKGHAEGGSDFLDYFGSISYTTSDGYRINNYLETIDFNGNLTLKPTDYLNLRFYTGYHKDWYGLPGAMSTENIDRVGRRGSAYPSDSAKTDDGYIMFGPEMRYDLGFLDLLFSGDVLARTRRTYAIFYSTWGTTEINNHIKTLGFTPKAAFTTDIFGIDNRMILGLDFYDYKDEILSGAPGPAKDLMVIEKRSIGLYATDTVKLSSSLFLNGGYRGEWAYYKFDQQQVLKGINKRSPIESAFEVGLNYKYNDKSAVYGNISRSMRFPAVDEWYSALWEFWGLQGGGLNLSLKPQVGMNYEVGIKERSSKFFSLEASYFLMDLKKEIYFDPVTLLNSNYERTMHQGVEGSCHVYLFDLLDTFANYTYEKAYFIKGGFAGNEIPMVPRHKFSTGFDISFMDCVKLSYIANFIGQRRLISDHRNIVSKLKAYLTQDMKLSYTKCGMELFAAINNIFNAKYSQYGVTNSAGTAQNFYPSPERSFMVGARYKF